MVVCRWLEQLPRQDLLAGIQAAWPMAGSLPDDSVPATDSTLVFELRCGGMIAIR